MSKLPDRRPEADAAAAFQLITTFADHGHSPEALPALINADPLTLATAFGFLVSRVVSTVPCPACGCPVRTEHDPGTAAHRAMQELGDDPQG